VFAFETSAALAFAFGMAVTGTITITTLLFFYIVWKHWRTPLWLVALGAAALLAVDLLFLAANLTKLVHGAWVPLLIGVTVFTVMTTWQRGRGLVTRQRERDEGSLQEFVTALHERQPPLLRVPGTAVFLNRGKQTAPLAMRASVEHYGVLHEHVVILSIETQPVPRVPTTDRLVIDDLGYTDDGITHVGARFGYMDVPNVPDALRPVETAELECPIEVDTASYSRVHHRAAPRRRADHGAVVQAPVPRHLCHHRHFCHHRRHHRRRRRRVFQPVPRPHTDRRLPCRGVGAVPGDSRMFERMSGMAAEHDDRPGDGVRGVVCLAGRHALSGRAAFAAVRGRAGGADGCAGGLRCRG
jgi:hypothetical protein